jgi:hypothetical protein
MGKPRNFTVKNNKLVMFEDRRICRNIDNHNNPEFSEICEILEDDNDAYEVMEAQINAGYIDMIKICKVREMRKNKDVQDLTKTKLRDFQGYTCFGHGAPARSINQQRHVRPPRHCTHRMPMPPIGQSRRAHAPCCANHTRGSDRAASASRTAPATMESHFQVWISSPSARRRGTRRTRLTRPKQWSAMGQAQNA